MFGLYALIAAVVLGVVWIFTNKMGSGLRRAGDVGGDLAEQAGGYVAEDMEAAHDALTTSVEFIGDEMEQAISDATFHPDDNREAIQNFIDGGVTGARWVERYEAIKACPALLNLIPGFLRAVVADAYSSPLKGMQFFVELAEPMAGRVEWTKTYQWLHQQVQVISEQTRGE